MPIATQQKQFTIVDYKTCHLAATVKRITSKTLVFSLTSLCESINTRLFVLDAACTDPLETFYAAPITYLCNLMDDRQLFDLSVIEYIIHTY